MDIMYVATYIESVSLLMPWTVCRLEIIYMGDLYAVIVHMGRPSLIEDSDLATRGIDRRITAPQREDCHSADWCGSRVRAIECPE